MGTAGIFPGFVVWCAAWLAPRDLRARWRREWLAELAHARQSTDRRAARGKLIRRSLLAFADALQLRFRGPSGQPPERRNRLDELRQDVVYGLRSMQRTPGFTLLAAFTIALGIGATTAMFSLVNGILLQPLPYTSPDRLVAIWPSYWVSAAMMEQLEERLDAYEAFAAYTPGEHSLIGPDGAERVYGPRVTAGFFDVLGRDVELGRTFAPGEDRGSDNVTVVTHAFWRDRLQADPGAVGRDIDLGGTSYTVIGVLRPGFDLMQTDAALAIPYPIDPDHPEYTSQDLKLIGRLPEGRSAASALPELQAFVDQVRAEYSLPDTFGRDATIEPLLEFRVGATRPMLMLLVGAVSLTFLIATANVAGLLLARALGRRREIAVRVALGARRGRLLRQLLTEATVLSLLGAIPGLLLARVGLQALVGYLPPDTPRLQEVQLDGLAVAFSVGLALVTGWLVGALPALQASRADMRAAMGESARGASESRGRRRVRSGLVLAELALAVTLAAGAGLLVKSFNRIQIVDPGIRADSLATFRVEPVADRFQSAEEAEVWFEELRRGLAGIPGVQTATDVWKADFREDGGFNGIRRLDVPVEPGAEGTLTRWRPVRPEFFEISGIRLVAGRLFDGADGAGTPPVAVISRAAARAVFGDDDPLGKTISTSVERETPVTVVGITEDVLLGGLARAAQPIVYRPYAQLHELVTRYGFYGRWLVLELQGEADATLADSVRTLVRRHDPTVLVAEFGSVRGAIDRSLQGRRSLMTLMMAFAATALLLGAVGIYGVMAYMVGQRTRELGIRMALGATRPVIVRGVLRDALVLAGIGGAIGLVLITALGRIAGSFVFEVSPADPWVLGGALLAALMLAGMASLGPAIRAGRADPARTLIADG